MPSTGSSGWRTSTSLSRLSRLPPSEWRILDFDLENRPLSYLGEGFTTAEITAIAWSWVGEEHVEVLLLDRHGLFVNDRKERMAPRRALGKFVAEYDRADIVTGHYIRKHDLPMLNGALLEQGMRPLKAKLTSDTRGDMMRKKDMSASQESLAEMYGLPEPKRHMTQAAWRRANRLIAKGMDETRERVVGDVLQHKALREQMVKAGHLKPPRVWSP